jgi:uncharacterized membrane protein YfcA
MTLAAAFRFRRAGLVLPGRHVPLFAITVVTSAVGAFVTARLPERVVETVIGASMTAMFIVFLARPRFGDAPGPDRPSRRALGLVLAAALGVYGGLFSGGYTTLLTFVCVGCFAMPLMAAVGLTKLVNFASSSAAALVFARAGMVDFRLGLPMAAAMAAGGSLGAQTAIQRGHGFVRAIFLAVVGALALKVLVIDLWLG